ncbi:MAG TPA: hypothetical protein VFP84_23425 [Kofleriaceae bacterium]|nr:hypothetical protein [Kofleriaceae bacterium]
MAPEAAHAQSAEAEVLFRDGRGLIKRGQLAAGCDKLAASERLESSVGTLLNLGDCREKLGKLASAWAAFRKAEAMATRSGGDDKRRSEAGRRAAALEPKLPNLVVEVPSRVDGLVVRRDDEVIDAAQWSTALPMDPGSYTIVAQAPGYREWRTTVPITATSRRQVVTVPPLVRAVAPLAPPTVAPLDGEPAASVVVARPAPRGTWSATRKASLAIGLAGAGVLGAGVYFGVHSNTLRDRSDRLCPNTRCGDAEGLRLNDDAKSAATRANVLFAAGGAVVATAVVLWLVGAPGETVIAPSGGEHQLGVSLAGSF